MSTILPESYIIEGKKRSKHFQVEGFVPGQGSLQPRFILVGEAPGETEAGNEVPFSGRAGKELMKMFAELGVTRNDVYITSGFRSRPYTFKTRIDKKTGEKIVRKANRAPTKAELKAHAFILDYELAHLSCDLLVPLGNIGLKRLLGDSYRITSCHGNLFSDTILHYDEVKDQYIKGQKEYQIFPMFHPAAVFYKPKLKSDIQADISRFKRLLNLYQK